MLVAALIGDVIDYGPSMIRLILVVYFDSGGLSLLRVMVYLRSYSFLLFSR